MPLLYIFFFSSRRRHTRLQGDWSSDVCSSDLSVSSNEQSECERECDPAIVAGFGASTGFAPACGAAQATATVDGYTAGEGRHAGFHRDRRGIGGGGGGPAGPAGRRGARGGAGGRGAPAPPGPALF